MAGAPPDDSRSLPLTPAQRQFLFLEQLGDEASHSAIEMLAVTLQGTLQREALQRAVRLLVSRHDALRTTIDAGSARQQVHADLELPVAFVDFAHLEGAEQAEAIEQHHRRAAETPFDLARGSPLRVTVLVRGPADFVLVLHYHHLLIDGYAQAQLLGELAALYSGLVTGEERPLAPPLQFSRYLEETLAEPSVSPEALHHWRERLPSGPVWPDLPLDAPRGAVQTFRAIGELRATRPGLLKTLQRRSAELRCTPFMVLMSAVQVHLHRLGAQDSLCVALPGRWPLVSGMGGMVGNAARLTLVPSDFDPRRPFAEQVQRFRSGVLERASGLDLPLDALARRLGWPQDPARPAAPVTFVFLPRAIAPSFAGLQVGRPFTRVYFTRFDLRLHAHDFNGELHLEGRANAELFSAATLSGHLAQLEELLASALDDPGRPVGRLPLLSADDRTRELQAPNRTERPWEEVPLLHVPFERQALERPQTTALTFETGELTYRELDRLANGLAWRLRELGVTTDARVGVCLDRSPAMVVALYAALKSGAAYVPLDPTHPPARLQYLVEDARPAVIISGREHRARLPETVPTLVIERDALLPAAIEPRDLPPSGHTLPDAAAYCIYTSGSTGAPKGAVISHRAIHNRLAWMQEQWPLQLDDVVLQKTPFGFDVSVWEFFWPLATGARLVLARPGGHHDPAYLGALIDAEKVTTLHFVPSMLQAFLGVPTSSPLPSLRRVLCSGEALPQAVAERFLAAHPHAEVHNLYGPTEAAVDVSAWQLLPGAPRRATVPIGLPIHNTQLHVLDAFLEPCPPGAPGELYIGGVGLARGYLDRPALSAERFIPDPFSTGGARLYRTGDRVRRLPGGELEYLGRLDFQVKLRGQRIELGEIEAVLLAQPGVEDAAVTLFEDAAGQRLVAFHVPRPDAAVDREAIFAGLRRSLPDPLLPSELVALQALPKSANGKLDRKALVAHVPPRAAGTGSEAVAPRTPAERLVSGLFAQALELSEVGVTDSFFALGGDSISAIRLVTSARAQGLPITVSAFLAHPTVEGLLRAVEGSTPPPAPDRTPWIDPSTPERLAASVPDLEEALPLSSAQQGMLLQSMRGGGQALYRVFGSCQLEGPLDPARLQQAWAAVVQAHPALRTTFHWQSLPELAQAVRPAASVPGIAFQELCGHPEDAQREAEAAFRRTALENVDLSAAPAVRLAAFSFSRTQHLLAFGCHHLLLDGWSMGLVLESLLAAYARLEHQPEAALEQQPSFREYLVHLDRQDHAEAERYWRSELAGLSTAAPESSSAEDPTPSALEMPLPADLTTALRETARRLRVSLASVLQTAWGAALWSPTGEDAVFAVALSGRTAALPGMERRTGMFINSLPLRVRRGGGAVGDLITDVHRQSIQLQRFEHSRLAEVQRWSGLASHQSLVPALFALEPPAARTSPTPAGLRAGRIEVEDRTEHGLVLQVRDDGTALLLRLRGAADVLRRLEARLRAILPVLATSGELSATALAEAAEAATDEAPSVDALSDEAVDALLRSLAAG